MVVETNAVSALISATGSGGGSLLPVLGFLVSIPLAFYIGRNLINLFTYIKKW